MDADELRPDRPRPVGRPQVEEMVVGLGRREPLGQVHDPGTLPGEGLAERLAALRHHVADLGPRGVQGRVVRLLGVADDALVEVLDRGRAQRQPLGRRRARDEALAFDVADRRPDQLGHRGDDAGRTADVPPVPAGPLPLLPLGVEPRDPEQRQRVVGEVVVELDHARVDGPGDGEHRRCGVGRGRLVRRRHVADRAVGHPDDAVRDDVAGSVHRDHAAAESIAGKGCCGHRQVSSSAAACSAGLNGAAARPATHAGRNSFR